MCVVRPLPVIATVLCILLSGCAEREDTKSVDLWPRNIQPMTEGARWRECPEIARAPGQVVQKSQCSPAPNATPPPCDDMDDAADAVRLIASCTDAAIARLEEETDTLSRSHLAAAYYVRAQRDDRPSDLLHALDAVTLAAAMQPPLPSAVFNRALIQEAIGLHEQAIASWSEFERLDASSWADEARNRRKGLEAKRAGDAAVQWPLTQVRINDAIRARDRATLARLMTPFPTASASYFTEIVLPQWAEDPSAQHLEDARFLAGELSRITGDRFPADVVAAIAASGDPAAVRQGIREYRAARTAQERLNPPLAARSFRNAVAALTRAGNPFRLEAEVRGSFYAPGIAAPATLDRLEREVVQRGYWRLNALIQSIRAHHLGSDRNFLRSLDAFDAVLAAYAQAKDSEELAKAHTRRAIALRIAGQYDLAWREVMQAMQFASHLRHTRDRNLLLGDATSTALALGHPETALLYADGLITLLQRELQAVPPNDLASIRGAEKNIAIARGRRAAVLIRLGRESEAREQADEATRLMANEDEPETHRIIHTAVEAVRGDALLRTDPAQAIEAFTRALEGTRQGELHAYSAWLYAQRAEARRRMKGDPEPDLLAALQELRVEESANLATRKRGEGEELWSAYFSRFHEPYQRLIRHYIDKGRLADAFRIAERARAYEPLHLVLQSPDAPTAFRDVIANDGANILPSARAMLPEGTFILQYAILEDRTFVFIVSKGVFEGIPLDVRARDIEKWRAEIQRAVSMRNEPAFDRAMARPYEELVSEPLRRVLQLTPHNPRLVFIPDGAMHGMPIAAFRDRATKQYLIQKAIVSVAPSTALYLHSRLRDAALPLEASPSLLLVGNPKFQKNALTQGLPDLPRAEAEVEQIAALYGDGVEILLSDKATVPAFLAQAQNKSIVHLAAHSIVRQSVLLFAPSHEHNGALSAQELITSLQLNRTRLMVLSTCSSAGGLPVGPEGVAPLVRPLLGAGVPAVIGSLWDVEDATAEEFLVSFHRHYQSGSDAASAMQRAQLALLGNANKSGRRSVLTWAPFQVIGHASSPAAAPQSRGTHNGLHPSNSVQRPDGLHPQ